MTATSAGPLEQLRIDRTDEDRAPRRRWPWLLLGAVVVVAAVAALWARTSRIEVRVATVEQGGPAGPASVLDASGYVTARRRATVSSKITGRVDAVLVEEGMRVSQGQVLARLDPTSPRAALELATARLEQARRGLGEIEARLREADLSLERARNLRSQKIASQAELDSAQANVDALRARLELARQDVTVASRDRDARAIDVEDTVIRAPFDGVAVSKDAQPGEMVSPISAGGGFTRTGICTVVDMSSLEIEVDVNENSIERVRDGQPVEARLDAAPERPLAGHVITTIPTADRQKATIRVRIAFDRLDPTILPDMGVRVAFLGPPRAERQGDVLLVPRAALRGEPAHEAVFVVRDGRALRTPVTAGDDRDGKVEILSGLERGQAVVVEGPTDLQDGARVRIASTPSKP